MGLPISGAIDDFSARMLTSDTEDRYRLAGHLEFFLGLAGKEHEALKIVDEMIECYPDDVRFPIKKATLNLYFLDNAEEALRSIDLALERAYRTLFFRREALGVKARILLKLGRGAEFSATLDEIMSMQMVRGIADVGRERDFVDRAPEGFISEDVLARYDRFRPKRAGDTRANEPPKYEPPEWE